MNREQITKNREQLTVNKERKIRREKFDYFSLLFIICSLFFVITCQNPFEPPLNQSDNNAKEKGLIRIYIEQNNSEYSSKARAVQPAREEIAGYQLTFSGSGSRTPVNITEGNSANVALADGTWTVTAAAYKLGGTIGKTEDEIASGSILLTVSGGAVSGSVPPIILTPSIGIGSGTLNYYITAGSGVSGYFKLFQIDGSTLVSSFGNNGEITISNSINGNYNLSSGRYIAEIELKNADGNVALRKEVIEIWAGAATVFIFEPTVFVDPDMILPAMNFGDFNVGSIDLHNISYADNNLTITGNGTYTIGMRLGVISTNMDRIVVANGVTADIILSDVNIDVSGMSIICAFDMSGANVNLTLAGENVLRSGSNRAGLEVPSGSTLVITNESTGSVSAAGGESGAGIGGGNSGTGGVISILGGIITATNGVNGAGIGGTITAITGNAVIFASSIQPDLPTGANLGPAIIFTGNEGVMYGNVTLAQDVTIPEGSLLRVRSGESLTIPNGVTLTNYGTIYKIGTINLYGNIIVNQPFEPPEMVYIPAGTFQMDGTDSGGTTRPVTLTDGFYMGKYEVTQEQWTAVMGSNPSQIKTPVSPETSTARRPVEYVSWYDAVVFCNRLSIMEGLTPAYSISGTTNPDDWGTVPTSDNATWNAVEIVSGATGYRLPTEAQWEYACRAGTTTAFNWGSNIINSSQANYLAGYVDTYNTAVGAYLGSTIEVGSYAPNAWGLYDMHGNVREWCWDWHGSYTTGAQTDPRGAASGSLRMLRGGNWNLVGPNLRSAARNYFSPDRSDGYNGFRLLRPSASTVKGINITAHPASYYVTAGSISAILNIAASVEQGTLTYQWYGNTVAANINGTPISGAASTNFVVPAALSAGTHYYFCEVRTDNGSPPVRSNVVTVIDVEMVFIPAGTFQMDGTDSGTTRPVTLTNGFYMGKYEVTQGQYEAVTGVNPSDFTSYPAAGEIQGRRPVEMVTWYDAVEFCNKLSEMEGLTSVYTITGRTPASGYPIESATVTVNWEANGYRLPTEAEWEYACRAGTTTVYNTGETISDNTGWYSSNSNIMTHEVGKKPPNAWGLYDMHGNVWEWCWDWYGDYTSGAQTDPRGAASGSRRVARGGSWSDNGQYLRSAYRYHSNPYYRNYDIGFRLLRPSASTVKGINVTSHPAPTHHVTAGSITTVLNIDSSVEQGTLSYQWYSNTIAANTGGTSVSGAASANFAIPANLSVGTYYYFCEVRTDNGAPKVRSNVVTVTVAIANPPITSISDAKIEMVWIPAGTFQMDGTDSGGTTRPVTLTNGFYMGKYEVTQEQYQAVMGSNPSYFKTPVSPETSTARRPVENVSWYDAIVFCNKLSVMEGLSPAYSISGSTNPNDWGTVPTSSNATWNAAVIVSGSTGYRLPTEAQWEYACRAGTTTAFNWGSNIINSTQANYDGSYVDTYNTVAGTYLGRTTEVGSYEPNAWGLYDMHGNVWEWCWDWYGSYTTGAQTDPTGAASDSYRVIRGGSWRYGGQALRSADRNYYYPYGRDSHYGFRLLRP